MDGREPVRFFGCDYADRPSRHGHEMYGSIVYDAMYEHR
jgi:hypothetical protein